MHVLPKPPANEAQPGNPGMGGFRHRSLHVEMKHGLGAAGTLLGEPPPAGVAHARRAVSRHALAHEIDIGVIAIGRPMALEVVEEGGPIRLEAMRLEIAQREGEAVIDADQRRRVLGELLHKPFGDPTP